MRETGFPSIDRHMDRLSDYYKDDEDHNVNAIVGNKTIFDARRILDDVSDDLSQLAKAFNAVGNEKISGQLFEASAAIQIAVHIMVETTMAKQAEDLKQSKSFVAGLMKVVLKGCLTDPTTPEADRVEIETRTTEMADKIQSNF